MKISTSCSGDFERLLISFLLKQVPGQLAGISQIFQAISLQLLDLIEWTKVLPLFSDLSPDDQVNLSLKVFP